MAAILALARCPAFCLLAVVNLSTFAASATFQTDPQYLIDTWETEDGLPENSATAMVQAPDGYLWFGTFNGLVRFDGVKFTVLDPANTPQLPSGGIVNLHLDKRGWLWVSTYEGLMLREGTGGRWRSFGTNEGWAGDYVRSFAERQNGDLLLTSFDGHVLEYANGRLTELPLPGGRSGHGYLGQVDEAGHWRVAQQWFVGFWDGRQWLPDLAITNLFGRIAGCAAARDGGFWVMAGTELLKIEQGRPTSRIELPDRVGNPWRITEDSRGNVWMATYDNGLSCVSPTGDFRQWTMTNGLSYNSTRFVFEDRESNLWVGTSGGGLQRFKPRRFQSFGLANGLPERVVRSLAPAPDGSLWIATYGKGLCKLSGSLIEPMRLPGPDNLFIYTQSVLRDRENRLWVATFGQSVWMGDTNGFHLVGAHRTGGHNVGALFEDTRGRIWMASERRVAVSEGETVRLLPERPELVGVKGFAQDRQGVIWLASHDGVFRLEDEKPIPVRDGATALRGISCLKADTDGMWLGSLRSGLGYWRDGRVTTIGPSVGLPVSAIHDMVEDGQGYLWLTSNRGIARVARSELMAFIQGQAIRVRGQLFDLADGLPSLECAGGQQPTCARDAAGRLWFSTMKGVTMVDPASLRLNTLEPPVQIESVSYQGPTLNRRDSEGPVTPGPITLAPRSEINSQGQAPLSAGIALPAGSKHIEIHYTAPSFVAPEKVKFQVKLEGRDSDWREVNSKRVAEFDELPPRKYIFRVRAANNDGVWNQTGVSLAFAVQPFFWQTSWFRIGAVYLLFSAGGATAWWQLRSRHRRALAELERSRQQQAELAHIARVSTMGELASSMAHELNQPLGAILSNAEAAELLLDQSPLVKDELQEILADIRKDDERAGEVIRRMRNLLRKREMDMTPLEVSSVVEDVLRLVRADASLRRTVIDVDLSQRLPLVLGDRVHLQQVLLNLIMNALESMADLPAERRRLSLRASLDGDHGVEIAVTDSGHGIKPDHLPHLFEPFYTTKPNGMGMGLSIARRIIEAHRGEIRAENNPEGGATFRVRLPMARGLE